MRLAKPVFTVLYTLLLAGPVYAQETLADLLARHDLLAGQTKRKAAAKNN